MLYILDLSLFKETKESATFSLSFLMKQQMEENHARFHPCNKVDEEMMVTMVTAAKPEI